MWNVTEACDELTEAPAVPFDGVCYSRNSSPASFAGSVERRPERIATWKVLKSRSAWSA